jgi:hypothetical protein
VEKERRFCVRLERSRPVACSLYVRAYVVMKAGRGKAWIAGSASLYLERSRSGYPPPRVFPAEARIAARMRRRAGGSDPDRLAVSPRPIHGRPGHGQSR